MVDYIEFFRLFDFSTWGEGLDGRFYSIFSTFRLFDLGGRVWMVDFIQFFRLFDFSTYRGEGLDGPFY